MDNPETLATLGTRQTNKQKTIQKTKTMRNTDPLQNMGMHTDASEE
jgi:hypothetical protein